MANAKLGHTFDINAVTGQIDVDTFFNVIKRKEQILYRSQIDSKGAGIGYIVAQDIELAANLSIADRSTSIESNRIRSAGYTITTAGSFDIDTDNILITNQFTQESNTSEPIPLFYKHILSTDKLSRDSNLAFTTGWKILSIEYLDSAFQPIETDYLLDSDIGVIYSNLVPFYSKQLLQYVYYYIRYTIRDAAGSTLTYVDLLDNQPTYSIATLDDLTSTFDIIPGHQVYLIEETIGQYHITLPLNDTHAYQATEDARLHIVTPVNRDLTDPWFVSVTDGKFYTNRNGTIYKYAIAEVLSQSFDPEPPIKKVDLEISAVLNKNLIKTDYNNLFEDEDLGLYLSLVINDSDDQAVIAFTTDPDLEGDISSNGLSYTKWAVDDKIGIQSIDHLGGMIKLEGITLKSNYIIYSTYYYKETGYEFTLVDFNPLNNPEILTSKISLFIDPDTLTSNKTQTLFYLRTDETGQVVESNWDDFSTASGVYKDELPLYYETFPDYLPSGDYHLFIDEFTVEASGFEGGNILVLGDLTVARTQGIDDLEYFDIRKRGGGILEPEIENAINTEEEVQWFWDIGYWDGIPYPGNASYLVEVPVTIMDGAGGTFLANEVRDVVNRHTAAGVYPISKAYGVEISISGIDTTTSGIILRWTSHGY